LNDDTRNENSGHYNKESGQKIRNWLGDKNPDKIRLVRLLMARLTWDWKSYEILLHGGKFKDIELQACSIDICHYAFPKNLDLLLQGIGQMKPVNEEAFEGCGSSNDKIKDNLLKEFLKLNDMLKSFTITGETDKNELIKAWLVACLVKTIKEGINFKLPIWL